MIFGLQPEPNPAGYLQLVLISNWALIPQQRKIWVFLEANTKI